MNIHCKYDSLAEVGSLKPHPKNRNKHPEEQIERLAKILKYQGVRAPIVVSNRSKRIVKGHGTLQAIKANQWEKAPVVYQDFEGDDQEWLFVQSDNAIAMWAELDLKEINADLSDLGPFDIDLIGIKDFTVTPEEKELGDEEATPEVRETNIKLGDLFVLGDHRLLCGDSTDRPYVEKLLDGQKVDLVVTDPPYNVAINDESEKNLAARNRRSDGLKIKNDKMSESDFKSFLRKAFSNYYEALVDGGSIYVFYADSMTIPFMTEFKRAGFHFAQNCIWNKHQFVMTRKDYHYKHEPILYGWKTGAAHKWTADRKQVSVWDFERPFKNEFHPTMKPIPLIEYPICNSASEGALVLDLFGGSGTTLIASEKTKRKCFMMELDPQYCQVIIDRWEQYTNKKAVKLG